MGLIVGEADDGLAVGIAVGPVGLRVGLELVGLRVGCCFFFFFLWRSERTPVPGVFRPRPNENVFGSWPTTPPGLLIVVGVEARGRWSWIVVVPMDFLHT